MKPFPQQGLTKQERLFNYQFSRARRTVEKDYGILAQQFQCLLSPIQQQPPTMLSCVVLHDYIWKRHPSTANSRGADREDPQSQSDSRPVERCSNDVIPGGVTR